MTVTKSQLTIDVAWLLNCDPVNVDVTQSYDRRFIDVVVPEDEIDEEPFDREWLEHRVGKRVPPNVAVSVHTTSRS